MESAYEEEESHEFALEETGYEDGILFLSITLLGAEQSGGLVDSLGSCVVGPRYYSLFS
jgi:hypothetical protein